MSRKRTFFHRTTRDVADAIVRDGFVDGESQYGYGFDVPLAGVWISDVPLTENEGADGDTLLAIKLTLGRARRYEVVEPGKPYREYLIPANILNQCARVRVFPQDAEDRFERSLWRRHKTTRLGDGPVSWRGEPRAALYLGRVFQRD